MYVYTLMICIKQNMDMTVCVYIIIWNNTSNINKSNWEFWKVVSIKMKRKKIVSERKSKFASFSSSTPGVSKALKF